MSLNVLRQKIATVETLNRRIYASLPWGYRVAQVLIKLSYNLTETTGRVFYSLFLKSGVEGMPPGAEPGTKPERLPRGYGHAFGQKIYAFVLKKVRNPDLAAQVLSELLMKVAKGQFKVDKGVHINKAESYVFQSAARAVVDVLRETKGRKDRNQDRKFEELDINLSDPSAFRELDELLPQYDLDQLLEELEDINDRAPSWLKAQLEGLSNVELAEQWGVGKSRINEWENHNLPKIKKVVQQYVRDLNA